MMNKNAPAKIQVDYRYQSKPFYMVEFNGLCIEEISINGALKLAESLEDNELDLFKLSYWDKEGLGMARKWTCDAEYFLSNYKLNQIDKG